MTDSNSNRNATSECSIQVGKFPLGILLGLFSLFSMTSFQGYSNDLKFQSLESFVFVEQDSLILKNVNNERTYIYNSGDRIIVWTSEEKIEGDFVDKKKGNVVISTTGGTVELEIASIEKIKVFSRPIARFAGGVLKGWGIAVGLAGMSVPFAWGLEGLIITVPALGVGFVIYKVGEIVFGTRRVKLNKKWVLS